VVDLQQLYPKGVGGDAGYLIFLSGLVRVQIHQERSKMIFGRKAMKASGQAMAETSCIALICSVVAGTI
jgi:hypothetical protein